MVNEDEINGMSFVFFEDVLAELGHKLHYDAIINYAGNSFMEKSWELISESNPFNMQGAHGKGGKDKGLAGFLSGADIKILGG